MQWLGDKWTRFSHQSWFVIAFINLSITASFDEQNVAPQSSSHEHQKKNHHGLRIAGNYSKDLVVNLVVKC